ncbi:zinc finger protein 701 [Hydra vulgaris]|uniref:Zinc finger protein 701 n=1 Tax=Hydra vulgaris TaxID=6087 RepID=A0ABM4CGE4_HYDVU
MGFGDVVEKFGRIENKSIADRVECVLDTCVRKDGVRYYKVAWRDTWEREDLLVACESVIKEFWDNLEKDKSINSKSSLPSYKYNVTSGRRKSHPKKFIGSENGQQTYKDYSNEALVVDIPECRPVDEYPVLIIRDSDVYAEPIIGKQANGEKAALPQSQATLPSFSDKFKWSYEYPLKKCDQLPRLMCHSTEKTFNHIEKSVHTKTEDLTSLRMTVINLNNKLQPSSMSYDLDSSSIVDQPNICEDRTKYLLRNSTPNSYISENNTLKKNEDRDVHSDNSKPTSHLLLKLSSTPPHLSADKTSSQVFPVFKASNGEGKRSIALPKNGTKPVNAPLHVVNENGEQRPQCAECFQTFKKRAALERHMMIHRGIKPFQCQFCSQKFRQKHHLQGHVMLHTGERPHSCTLCNKKFRMRHHLLEHERISHKVFR